VNKKAGIAAGVVASVMLAIAFYDGRKNLEEDMIDPLVRVPAELTRLSEDEACDTLRAAFIDLESREPTSDELAMLLSQSALETALWEKMYCWNWGNSVTVHGNYFLLGSDNRHKYKAFPDATAGAKAWLTILKNSFALAWLEIGSADTEKYAMLLQHGKYGMYYEADKSQYVKALNSHYSHMLFVVARNQPTVPEV